MQASAPLFGSTPPTRMGLTTYGQSALNYRGKSAAEYDAARPDYPTFVNEVFRDLGIGCHDRILDLASGTGKFTRALLSFLYETEHPEDVHGSNIVALESNADMRLKFSERLPYIPLYSAFAENMPSLKDNSFDVVAVATAFHWFEGEKALKEIWRVLDDDGTLLLTWLMLDPLDKKSPWVAKVRDLLNPKGDAKNHDKIEAWSKPFQGSTLFTNPLTDATHRTHTFHLEFTPEEIAKSLLTFNAAGQMSQSEKDALEQNVYQILANDPTTAGLPKIRVPYRLEVYWCRKLEVKTKKPVRLLSSSMQPGEFERALSGMRDLAISGISRARSHINLPQAQYEDDNDSIGSPVT